jgi:hypothetical protein
VQAPGDKAARQLAAPTPDLKHLITAPDPCDLTGLVDQFVRISRTVAVVLSRDLIKNLAVTTCRRLWQPCHPMASVHVRYCDRQTVAAFAARLKDAVDLDQTRAELLDVIHRSLEPAYVSVWISQDE